MKHIAPSVALINIQHMEGWQKMKNSQLVLCITDFTRLSQGRTNREAFKNSATDMLCLTAI